MIRRDLNRDNMDLSMHSTFLVPSGILCSSCHKVWPLVVLNFYNDNEGVHVSLCCNPPKWPFRATSQTSPHLYL
jgi:hypothetical protein